MQAVLPVYQSNVLTLMSSISLPSRDSDVCSFLVPQDGERPPGDTWKAARLKVGRVPLRGCCCLARLTELLFSAGTQARL